MPPLLWKIIISDFFTHIDSLRANINKISELVEKVTCLHSTLLSVPQADKRIKEELEEKMTNITRIAKNVSPKLKEMQQEQERYQTLEKKFQASIQVEKL
ncbi:unnamed protein product [Rotaria sordida]|uniref:Syntaxin N-terminal domain-containing protein n=1 Tax=Rotaria sordida TaxID=392033 RepID=A0A815FZ65_9BILA|nr:unnamed protein product [Rotaria sordida]